MLRQIRNFLISPGFLFFPLLVATLGLVGGEAFYIPVMAVLCYIIGFVFFFSDDFFPSLFPILAILTVGTSRIHDLEIIVPYLPLAIPTAIGFVFHLIRYRRPFRPGESLKGLWAVSLAVLLGGIGVADIWDLFTPEALYHTLGLSFGLVFFYFICKENGNQKKSYAPISYFLRVMLLLGILCSIEIFSTFFRWLIPNIRAGNPLEIWMYLDPFHGRNTFANLLMPTVPACAYFARDGKTPPVQHGAFFLGVVFFAALLLTFARTAFLLGTVLFLFCVGFYLSGKSPRWTKLLHIGLLLLLSGTVIFLFREEIVRFVESRLVKGLVSPKEPRFLLLGRSLGDFLAHPLFGIGLYSTQNSDIYSAPGCITWYHMYFPQIWGSMGVFGLGAFLYHLAVRYKLMRYRPSPESTALALSYFGLFLYSQTDPGEFIPIPFGFLGVLIFVLLEERMEKIETLPKEIFLAHPGEETVLDKGNINMV